MRKFILPHTVKWLAVCIAICSTTLIFQGCGGGEPSEVSAPYAKLDAAFPEGRPGIADVATRTQDAEYLAKIAEGAEKFSALSAELKGYDRELEHIKNEVATALSARMGVAVPEDLLAAKLEQHPLYQSILEKRTAAQAAVEAQRKANIEAVRARMTQDRDRYDAMLAEADAAAKAAGLPTRAEALAAEAKAKVATPAQPTVATIKDLSEQTGIPVAPTTEGASK